MNNNDTVQHKLPYTREFPQDLSKEQLLREAEKVIAQSERVKCIVDSPGSLAGVRLQEKQFEGDFVEVIRIIRKSFNFFSTSSPFFTRSKI